MAALLSGRAADYRISSPPAFNVTLSIYDDEGAEKRLAGENASPLVSRSASRPFTVRFEPDKLGTYLLEVRNHDPIEVFVMLSEETLPGVDRLAMMKAGAAAGVGVLLLAWGLFASLWERQRSTMREG